MNFHDLLNMLGTLQKTLLQDIWREGIYLESLCILKSSLFGHGVVVR